MKLKLHSWHCWLFRSAYGTCPNNLCPYFWGLVFAILLFPICWMTHVTNLIIERKYPESGMRQWIGILISVGSIAIGAAMLQDAYQHLLWLFNEYGDVGAICVMMLWGWGLIAVILAGLSVCAGIGFLIMKIAETRKDKKLEKEMLLTDEEREALRAIQYEKHKKKRKWILFEFIKAAYGKYCPKIDWK